MIDTSVKFVGLDFKSPISIASHGPCLPRKSWPSDEEFSKVHMKFWRKYYEDGVGSLTTGSIYYDEMPEARGMLRFGLSSTKGSVLREGTLNAATMPDSIWPHTAGLMAVEKAKREFTDMRIIASILGPGTDPEGWGSLALDAQHAGADAVELNLGSVMMWDTATDTIKAIVEKDKIPGGAIIGLVPEAVAEIIKGIKKKTNLPVIPKVTAELGMYRLLYAAPMYREAGAGAVTCDHTFMVPPPPDIYNHGKTTHPHFEKTSWWSTAGPFNRVACYRDVTMVAKHVPGLDIEACGGLVIPEHAIEVMMLGAKLVQLSSGIHYNGISYPGRVIKFVHRYMEDQGYNNVNDFIGEGLQYIVDMGEMQAIAKSQSGKVVAGIDYDKCVGLDNCRICLDNWCLAVYEEDGQIKVHTPYCNGCNLCVIRCPHGARYLTEI